MPSHIRWAVACLLAFAACKGEPPGATRGSSSTAAAEPTLPQLTDKMPSSVSAERPAAQSGEEARGDLATFDEVYKQQADAVGKTVLFRGYGTPLGPTLSHLSECKASTERANVLAATFQPAQRDLMRAMPSSQFMPAGASCPRVLVKVSGFDDKHRWPQGEVVAVYDLQPDPTPANLPAGVDFVAMDDLFLAGPSAVGKTADFGVYLGQQDGDWMLVATGCGPHGGWNAHLFVAENDANRSFFRGLKAAGPSTCVRVRAKVLGAPTDPLQPRWRAELVGVGQQYRKPHPPPNP